MQGSLDGLLHDAAAVYRLVEFIEHFCIEQRTSRSYVEATREFFKDTIRLAAQTKKYLVDIASEAKTRMESGASQWNDVWFANERETLYTIKGSWNIIHRYLKPAADAHTLEVPVPLVQLAERQLHLLPKMRAALIAVLLTPELNYFQTSHTRLKTAIRALEDSTGISPEHARNGTLGFVELPFSQGPSFFTNLALYHELGHFAIEENYPDRDPLASRAEEALKDVYAAEFTNLPEDEQAGARQWLRKWAEEIFCDLFAVRLIGPAFSLASIEMFSLIGFLTPENKTKFLPSHPAAACRFREQLEVLKDDHWWETIKALESDHVAQIAKLAETPEDQYSIYIDRKKRASDQRALRAFRALLPHVRSLAKDLTSGRIEGQPCFTENRERIENCLSHGVVPSRLYTEQKLFPAYPIAIVNAAFCFYLKGLQKLISGLDGQDANKIDHRSHWTKRLEMWTIKAIEDFFLLDGVREYGGRVQGGSQS
jgi:hypothetical protein